MEAEIGDATPPAKAGAGRIVLGFVFALISAVMLFLMWNYTANLWPLVLIAFVLMYVAAYRLLPRKLAPSPSRSRLLVTGSRCGCRAAGSCRPRLCTRQHCCLRRSGFVLGIFERRFTERTNYKWFIVQLPLLWIGLEVLFQDNLLVGSNYWIGYRMAALPRSFNRSASSAARHLGSSSSWSTPLSRWPSSNSWTSAGPRWRT